MEANKQDQFQTIDWVLAHCYIHKYPSKSNLLYPGKKSKKILYLIKGIVVIVIKDDKEEKEIILSYLNQGFFIGQLQFFNDYMNYGATWIRAKTSCEIAEISYNKFIQLIHVKPKIIKYLFSQITHCLQITYNKVYNLAFLDVTARISQTLLKLAQQPDAITHPYGIKIKITRQEISQFVGCSRETVGRIFQLLQNKHLISSRGKEIVIYGYHY
ncbi:MAG: cAMP-activated global transcriptional regulator CRP [Candidatus Dasytiphilus stammeri]